MRRLQINESNVEAASNNSVAWIVWILIYSKLSLENRQIEYKLSYTNLTKTVVDAQQNTYLFSDFKKLN